MAINFAGWLHGTEQIFGQIYFLGVLDYILQLIDLVQHQLY